MTHAVTADYQRTHAVDNYATFKQRINTPNANPKRLHASLARLFDAGVFTVEQFKRLDRAITALN